MDDTSDQPGPGPNEQEAAAPDEREQDDQHADDGIDPELRKTRAEAKRYRLAAREAQAQVKELTDREKTEMQKLIERAESAEARAQRAELAELKVGVAGEFGIPASEIHRLQGDTREALAADAKAFARTLGLDSSNGEQRPNFSSGVRRPIQRPKTMNDVIRQASGR